MVSRRGGSDCVLHSPRHSLRRTCTTFRRLDDLLVRVLVTSRQSVHLALRLSDAKSHLIQHTPCLRAITLNASAAV